MDVDVLCVGHASYDLIFSVAHHPKDDEKISADDFLSCGGGPAANAAITISRLGFNAGFAGYLGNDIFGENHYQELIAEGINTQCVIRDHYPTPLSTILVKPDGKRALINYKGATKPLTSGTINFSSLKAKVVLFDGHEPNISLSLLEHLKKENILTVLDAGSVHEGTLSLMDKVDYLVCSEKFAIQYAGNNESTALSSLAKLSPNVIITLGERGLIWQRGKEIGHLKAFNIEAVDTTGAGDAFHGAFAAALTTPMNWLEILQFSSAAGALCCTKVGARIGLPTKLEHDTFLNARTI